MLAQPLLFSSSSSCCSHVNWNGPYCAVRSCAVLASMCCLTVLTQGPPRVSPGLGQLVHSKGRCHVKAVPVGCSVRRVVCWCEETLRAKFLSLCVSIGTAKPYTSSFGMRMHVCVPPLPPLASRAADVTFTAKLFQHCDELIQHDGECTPRAGVLKVRSLHQLSR